MLCFSKLTQRHVSAPLQLVSKYWDGKKAVKLYDDVTLCPADCYAPGPRGFAVATWEATGGAHDAATPITATVNVDKTKHPADTKINIGGILFPKKLSLHSGLLSGAEVRCCYLFPEFRNTYHSAIAKPRGVCWVFFVSGEGGCRRFMIITRRHLGAGDCEQLRAG